MPNHPLSRQKSNYMQQDLRGTDLWNEVDKYVERLFEPSVDQVSGASDLAGSPNGKQIAFTGNIHGPDWRNTPAKTRICIVDVDTSELEVITSGPNNERLPKWAPDGKTIAFLSDRAEEGIFQLYLLKVGRLGEAEPIPFVSGMVVEDYHWSLDGSQILLQSAGLDADKGDGGGSGKVGQPKNDLPNWMPNVDSGDTSNAWRSLWVYDLEKKTMSRESSHGCNVWEAAWCGPKAIISIATDSPLEDAWYKSTLRIQNLSGGEERVLYEPKWQLGCPVASPSGKKIAVIEGAASDRGLVPGEIKIIDAETGTVGNINSKGTDVSQLIWRGENSLFYIGNRSLNTVAGEYPPYPFNPNWESPEACGGGLHPVATLLPNEGFAIVRESWTRPPEISVVEHGKLETILSFNHKGYKSLQSDLGTMTPFNWYATDDLEMQGFLHRPKGNDGKYGLIVNIHGGPIYANMNTSTGVNFTSLLNSKGYAVFRPNPRGSMGRGQKFAQAVVGDMGGADAQDILSGIRAVCKSDPRIDTNRIGIVGGSYGGFMASLLPTLDPCFKASVSIAAVTDWHSFQ